LPADVDVESVGLVDVDSGGCAGADFEGLADGECVGAAADDFVGLADAECVGPEDGESVCWAGVELALVCGGGVEGLLCAAIEGLPCDVLELLVA
jgi:hypothetical protein